MRNLRLLLVAICLAASSGYADEIALKLRFQHETAPGSGNFERQVRAENWKAEQTAVIVCDVWDYHHCLNAVRRLEEFAPRINRVLAEARTRGATIIHSPSDCMEAYATHPARQRAQAAPKPARLPANIENWCSRIPAEERGVYPIDQSDGGEDDDPAEHAQWAAKLKSLGRNPARPWKMQSPLITIDSEQDYVSDRGDEVWSILQQRGIMQVILTGVHTNMCVLGRPFGLRQMVKNGMQTVLMRDMTDCMYNPQRWPHVDHLTGNELIVSHVERYVCPTITSDQLLGGEPFRFRNDTRTARDVASLTATSLVSRADFEKDWMLISIPSEAHTNAVKDSKEFAWYRCALRIPRAWKSSAHVATLHLSTPSEQSQAWLNGAPLPVQQGKFRIPSQAIEADDANLLVIRVARGDGMQLPPSISAGASPVVLKGRWQMRLGDDPRWSNIPLPAKFGTSPDILFELD